MIGQHDIDPYLRLSDFPIPDKVEAGGPGWSPLMNEMADHIGARHVLLLCDALGGRQVCFPMNHAKSPVLAVLGEEKGKALCWAFEGERRVLPTARLALSMARRASVVAMVRSRKLTQAAAAIIVGCHKNHFSEIINKTSEGIGIEPGELPVSRWMQAAREAADIAAARMREAACRPDEIERCRADIIAALVPAGAAL